MANEIVKAKIEKIVTGGAGLAKINGKSIFVNGTIPGETIVCRITGEHRSWAEAELQEIVEASAVRAEPACGYYGKCGGCNLQHMEYKAQLSAKESIVKDNFIRIGGIVPPALEVIPSKPWEYRNRMQFHVSDHGGLWGLKARKGNDVIPVSDCPVADPGIRQFLRTTVNIKPAKNRFTVYARNGLLLMEGEKQQGITEILNRKLTVDARIFFQSNGAMLEKLVPDLVKIASCADHTMPMADLYCGAGVFAAFLGSLFSGIDLAEENKSAVTIARKNLAEYPYANFFTERSEDWAKKNKLSRYGFIIADPPRQGLDRSLALQLAEEGPPILAYVSCDPATLARDSKILLNGAYRLKELSLYDFYPQTSHIECLALFEK